MAEQSVAQQSMAQQIMTLAKQTMSQQNMTLAKHTSWKQRDNWVLKMIGHTGRVVVAMPEVSCWRGAVRVPC